jgi:serine/threonine-protein kinase RsbW
MGIAISQQSAGMVQTSRGIASVALELRLVSNPLLLSGVREMVSSVSRRLGFSEEAAGHLALGLDEALCNVIRHGYQKAVDKPIRVVLLALGGIADPETGRGMGTGKDSGGTSNPTTGLMLIIEDESPHVDLSKIKSRPLDEIRPGGLGVHIIHELMDDVKYEHVQPMGMRLTMTKLRLNSKTDKLCEQAACKPEQEGKR